jgi:hypothetical protein
MCLAGLCRRAGGGVLPGGRGAWRCGHTYELKYYRQSRTESRHDSTQRVVADARDPPGHLVT